MGLMKAETTSVYEYRYINHEGKGNHLGRHRWQTAQKTVTAKHGKENAATGNLLTWKLLLATL
jgi:hypothetical protein